MPYKDLEKGRVAAKVRQRKYREKNREKINLVALGRYHKIYKKDEGYLEKSKEYGKKYREENKEKLRAYYKKPEIRKKASERMVQWQKDNPGKVRARSAYRKKKVKEATPPWADKKQIAEIYVQACEMEEKTGVKYHVDHIVPITNDRVCGLHIPWNLQIIPAKDNLKKGNKFN